MNVNRYCGDAEESVAENMDRLCGVLGTTPRGVVTAHQTHGTRVLDVTPRFLVLDDADRAAEAEGVDALITAEPYIYIGVSTADCVPILMCDTERRVVAAVHAGWRGTCARILVHTVEAMVREYGCRPHDIMAHIGPSISAEAFEVGDEVYDAFRDAHFPMSRIATKPCHKWHIDLPGANALTLAELGVRPENVRLSGECTYKQSDKYFSARRLSINSGRLLSAIALRPAGHLPFRY